MRKLNYVFLFLFALITSCNIGHLPDNDLSLSNIKSVQLEFPQSSHRKEKLKLDSMQIVSFANIVKNRGNKTVNPTTCYTIYIELKDGNFVHYRTDGLHFQGFEDSTDLPFAFTTQTNILTTVFHLQTIDSCE